ncbi:MAG: uracil-DNA glycosylase [Desulfobulbaceae bacterium]|nr:uracil-DNA glycosylase [Desulfobulbaceae bacterium]
MKENRQRPNCYQCRHFYITHEPDHPYGCRPMGFKSVQLPSVAVFNSSGMECQMFTLKQLK